MHKALVGFTALALCLGAQAQQTGSTTQGTTGAQPGTSQDLNNNTVPDQPTGGAITDQGRMPSSDPTASEQGRTTGQNIGTLSPQQVCQRLVQLGAQGKVQQSDMSRWMVGEKRQNWSKLNKRDWLRDEISQITCSSETIAGNHAFVVARTAENQERLIPFLRQSGQWKLDAQAYRTMYRMEHRTPASQKSK